MNPTDVPRIAAGCPWCDWAPPNLKWCEENLCAWITTPANTWSNLAYLAVAVVIWRMLARTPGAAPELRFFPPAVVLLGLGSFAYHASYTFFFQVFDFVGMYLVLGLFVVINLRRAGLASPRTQAAWYAGFISGMTLVMLAMAQAKLPYQALIAVLVAVIGVQEALIARRTPAAAYGDWWRAWALFAIAFTCSALDLTRVWCDPTNHWMQGHAVWHVFSALGILSGFRFYLGLSGTPAS